MSDADLSEVEAGRDLDFEEPPGPIHVRVLRALTAVLLFAMMALGFSDVVLRYLFNSPIYGALPVMGFLLGLVVFTSLPLISISEQHITVDLFERAFVGRFGVAVRWFVVVTNIVATAFIAERMASFAISRRAMGQMSDMIDIELWPFAFAFSILSGLTCLMLAVKFARRVAAALRPTSGRPGES